MEEAGGRPRATSILGVIGLVLHLATGVFPYAASGLVAPIEGYVVLYALWLGLLVVAVRLYRVRNSFVLLIAPASVAVWLAVIGFGGAVLGWTA